ncbi:16S rRNA (guanine(966)-N(2))-methyltransferase RsmD [Aliikangiella sp. IMCC44653]
MPPINSTKPDSTKKNLRKHKQRQNLGQIRIIGGQMRGRKLSFQLDDGLRPTLDRIRETVFNWLSPYINQANCLDLFAGSGALGFEALSRGAKQVTFVEKSPKVLQSIQSNCQLLKVSHFHALCTDAERFIAESEQQFDVIFLDPPFGKGILAKSFSQAARLLAPGGVIYLEQESSQNEFVPSEDWEQLKYKQTSSLSYALYSKKA